MSQEAIVPAAIINPSSVAIICVLCNHVSASASKDADHYRATHKNGTHLHACPNCKKNFSRKKILLTHFKTAHSGGDTHNKANVPAAIDDPSTVAVICVLCNNVSPSAREDMVHYRAVHKLKHASKNGADLHTCPKCKKNFSRKSNLLAHFKIAHSGDFTKFKCYVCDEEESARVPLFTSLHLLRDHIKNVHVAAINANQEERSFKLRKHAFNGAFSDYIWLFSESIELRKNFYFLKTHPLMVPAAKKLMKKMLLDHSCVKISLVVTVIYEMAGEDGEVVDTAYLYHRARDFRLLSTKMGYFEQMFNTAIDEVARRSDEVTDLQGSGWTLVSIESLNLEFAAVLPLLSN